MHSFWKKLTSRKFLLSCVSMATGIALLCGADAATVSVIAGAAMTVLPSLVYCLIEGRIDSAAVTTSKEAILGAADDLGVDKPLRDVIDAAGDMLAALGDEQAK
jgi:hypothetical protein